jgi:glycosyltransferase involved in cell wall biosynthesis
MAKMDLVSVALPVWRDDGTLERACWCMLAQTWREIEVLIVLNGADERTEAVASGLARRDGRVRVLKLREAGLAAALNVALREARGELVARMDADDECAPERVARQVAFLKERARVGVVGCAYDVVGVEGRLFTVRPPVDEAEARWRLLLGNSFAHGSMLLRKRAVLEVGGYDESCARAQDFELWLRLSRTWGVAAVPEVLYTHHVRDGGDATRSTGAQAGVACAAMLRTWRGLAFVKDEEGLLAAMAGAMSQGRDPGEALVAIEKIMNAEGPSREALLAWLWARHVSPPADRVAVDVGRRARVREVFAQLKREGVREVWLWGAGDHTRKVLEHPEDLGVSVRGIVDDRVRGERFGVAVVGPEALCAGDVVVLSSDWHEGRMWESSAGVRGRGVRVVRLYG